MAHRASHGHHSMDEVLPRLLEFASALRKFQDSIEGSMRDMRRTHDAVDPLWRDNSRREYDSVYSPLEDRLRRYVEHESPILRNFIESKAMQIDRYLHGHGRGR